MDALNGLFEEVEIKRETDNQPSGTAAPGVPAPTAEPGAGVTSESVEKAKQKKKAQRETQLKAALTTVPLDAYYDTSKSKYLVLNAGGRRLPLDTGQFKKRLQQEGFSTKTPEEGGLSPADTVTIQVQDHRDVCYAAPLAGRMAGFCEEGGHRFLVTDSPRFIPAVKGEWPTLRELLNNLFTKGEEGDKSQLDTVYTWLKGSIEALRAGRTKEAQCLAMAGPPQSGKSLFQKIITRLLGGRAAKPYLFLSGKTPFNAELFGAEHLMLEDEHMSNRCL